MKEEKEKRHTHPMPAQRLRALAVMSSLTSLRRPSRLVPPLVERAGAGADVFRVVACVVVVVEVEDDDVVGVDDVDDDDVDVVVVEFDDVAFDVVVAEVEDEDDNVDVDVND